MDFFKIIATGMITAFCAMTLKETKSGLSVIVTIVGCCMMSLMLIEYIGYAFGFINDLCGKINVGGTAVKTVIKIVGIGYITEFAASIVEESGSKAMADKIVMAGKIIILIVSLPILSELFDLITELLR